MDKEFDKILYVAAFTSIAGLLILSFSSEMLEPPLMPINSISVEHIEKNVHVKGTIESIKTFRDGSASIKFYNSTVDIYLPKTISEKVNFTKGMNLELTGTVKLYQGKIEILVGSIKNIRVTQA